MGVTRKNMGTDFEIIGVAATQAAYLTLIHQTTATEGMTYYDTTLNQLRTYNGSSWNPAGLSNISGGSLNSAANIGSVITSYAVEINNLNADDLVCLTLDQDDTGSTNVLVLENAGTGNAIDITNSSTGVDIDGTGSTWTASKAGVITGTGFTLGDSQNLTLGAGSDITVQWDGTDLLVDGAAADTVIKIGATNNQNLIIYGGTATNLITFDTDDTALLCDFDGFDLRLKDNDQLIFGDGSDVLIDWDGTNMQWTAAADDSTIILGNGTNDFDLQWFASDAGDYVLFDASAAVVDLIDVNIDLDDDSLIRFGSSNDFTIQCIAGSPNTLRITGDSERIDIGVANGGMDMYWFSNTTGRYMYWDEDSFNLDMININLRLDDDAILYFGTDQDASINWDNTNSTLDVGGNVVITGTLAVSGAFDIGNFTFADDEEMRFGTSDDFVIHYDSSAANLQLDAAAANDEFTIGATTATDVRFTGTNAYDILYDASADTLLFEDNAKLVFGTGSDVTLLWDANSLNITGSGMAIEIGADTAPLDVKWFGTTTGDYIIFDADGNTNGELIFEDCSILLNDNTAIRFGDSAGEGQISSDGSDIVCTGNFNWGVDGTGVDVIFYGDTLTSFATWDFSEDALTLEDDTYVKLGTGNDLVMGAAGSTVTFTMAAASTMVIADTDNAASLLTFGTTGTNGLDVLFQGATAGSYVDWDAGADTWNFGVDNKGVDVKFFSETAGDSLLWDQDGGSNLGALIFEDAVLQFAGANVTYSFAISTDAMALTATDHANANLALGSNGTNGLDITYTGQAAGETITLDSASATLTFEQIDIVMNDTDNISFGDSAAEGSIYSDGSTIVCNGAFCYGVDGTGVDVILYGDTASSNLTWDQDGDTNGSLILTGASQTITGIDSGGNLLTVAGIDTTGNSDSIVVTHSGSGKALKVTCNEADSIAAEAVAAASQTTALVHLDGSTGSWIGAATTGMLDIDSDGALVADGALVRIESTGNISAANDGACLEIVESGAAQATSYAMRITSTNNEALHVDAGKVLIDETIEVTSTSTLTGAVTCTAGCQSAAVARTASADGTGTGTIADGTSFVTLTSADAAKICVLPTPTPGNVVWIAEDASNGYELRTDTPASVAINGGSGEDFESAIAGAITLVRCVCVSATAWICSQFDADGDESKVEVAA